MGGSEGYSRDATISVTIGSLRIHQIWQNRYWTIPTIDLFERTLWHFRSISWWLEFVASLAPGIVSYFPRGRRGCLVYNGSISQYNPTLLRNMAQVWPACTARINLSYLPAGCCRRTEKISGYPDTYGNGGYPTPSTPRHFISLERFCGTTPRLLA